MDCDERNGLEKKFWKLQAIHCKKWKKNEVLTDISQENTCYKCVISCSFVRFKLSFESSECPKLLVFSCGALFFKSDFLNIGITLRAKIYSWFQPPWWEKTMLQHWFCRKIILKLFYGLWEKWLWVIQPFKEVGEVLCKMYLGLNS